MANSKKDTGEAGLKPRYRLPIAVLIITCLVFLIYGGTLYYPFQFDDLSYILNNEVIRNLSDFWPPLGTRYLTYLSFALNYRFADLSVSAFRLTNIAIHIVNSVFVYLLVSLTLKTPLMKGAWKGDEGEEGGFYMALMAALVFAAHPVNTQAVTYITQRFASLATAFYLGSVILYVKWRADAPHKTIFYMASVLFAVSAQKTKEISFTLPLIISLYEFTFFDDKKGAVKRLLHLLPFISSLAVIPLTLFFESGLTEGIAGQIKRMQIEEMTNLSRHDYLITQFRVIVTYIRLLVFPVNQSVVYDFPLYHSFFTPEVLLSSLFLAALFSFAVYLRVRSRRRGEGVSLLVSFGLLWFFITLSIESSLIPIKDLAFEHRIYLPGVGAAMASAAFLFYALGRVKDRGWLDTGLHKAAIVMVLLIVIPLGASAFVRNRVWKDDNTLWSDAVRKSPGSPRAQYNLAWTYHNRGDSPNAIAHYREAVRLDPDKEEAHYNLAMLYQSMGDNMSAIRHYRESIRIKPGKVESYYNLGIAYQASGDNRAAIDSYKEALKIDPSNENAHYNLAYAYQEAGDYGRALEHYNEATRLNPKGADAHFNIGVIYAKENLFDRAKEEFSAALRIDPGYREAEAWLKKISYRKGRN